MLELINPSGAETGILLDKWVNITAAKAPTPYVSRTPPEAMILPLLNERAYVFHKADHIRSSLMKKDPCSLMKKDFNYPCLNSVEKIQEM